MTEAGDCVLVAVLADVSAVTGGSVELGVFMLADTAVELGVFMLAVVALPVLSGEEVEGSG